MACGPRDVTRTATSESGIGWTDASPRGPRRRRGQRPWLDALGGEGVDELSALLREPAIRDQVTKAVRDGVESLLRKPLREIVGAPDAARVHSLSEGLSKGALSLLRSDSTQRFVAGRIESALDGWRTGGSMIC